MNECDLKRRRLSEIIQRLVNVGFTEEQMNKMSMSFKNRIFSYVLFEQVDSRRFN